jgi:hypothetical protein
MSIDWFVEGKTKASALNGYISDVFASLFAAAEFLS